MRDGSAAVVIAFERHTSQGVINHNDMCTTSTGCVTLYL